MVLLSTRTITLGAVALFLVGCDAPTPPEPAPLDDAISHVQLADQLSAFARIELGVPIAPERLRGRERCPFNPQARRFDCPEVAAGALTYRRSYQLVLEDGTPTESWDASVATIRYVADISGSVNSGTGTVTVSRHDESTLGDLRQLRQTLLGTASLSWNDGTSTWTGRRSTRLEVMSRARMPGTFPTGSIELTVDRVSPAARRVASMAFDGTSVVKMLVSFDGQASLSCVVDLAASDATSDCR